MNEIINITEMSENDLIVLRGFIDKEILKRKNEERGKLIENFQKAFYALLDAGVSVEYDNYYDDTLVNWDNFYFN